MPLQDDLMNDPERRYNIEHQLNVLLNVLRRPIDVTAKSGHSLGGSNNLVPFWGIPQKHIVIGIGS